MHPKPFPPAPLPRRRFVQTLAAAGLAGAAPWSLAATAPRLGSPEVLRGTEFDLVIEETWVNHTGRPALATTVNGSLPGPTLRWREGETVTIRVHNRLREPTSIHWHGLILPYQMDGVPGISFAGIPAGATFTYRFEVRQSGSYWYHSHSGFQEMRGLYGSIVIDPARAPARPSQDRDYTVLLSDWTDEDPMRILGKLRTQSSYYNYQQPTALDFLQDVSATGWRAALDRRQMWNQMRMSPTDLSDLSAATLTHLINGTTAQGNWTGLFRPGERLRLRLVNGSGNTFYDVRIPGLPLRVVQVDGQEIEPVTVDEFRFGPGETCDVVVVPKDDAYTLFAQTMDRSGHARATLAVRQGLSAPVPERDKVEWLSMADMMGAMDHGAMAGMDHGAMAGMQGMGAMTGMQPMAGADEAPPDPLATPGTRVRHARTEYGPSTDMRVDTPRTNLDDPGIGLRNNGRRVLTLADMKTLGGPPEERGPGREIELHLTGNMDRYTWSFDGLEFSQSTPVAFRHGERLRVILHNDTMMTHPMHLHGMWSDLETADGDFQVRRHTIPVQPAQRVSFLVTADALGRWAWHCHLMLHMEAGMFREVVVA
ncbi:copper resistance system multicopper oxidase [Xylophilus rhododendri]|uniref:Copper resistance system multicopper oxidase n=1 Tax=Xylophilus rhododendri TaxID=2697032 RepID=A0A857J8F0_9BURK|nr:copper resistance system multicopper oxidase [Xylophilus rhododendri]QHI99329.1 copper resistance system multicopper oxidase [Xylophilus rhododendri]